MTAAAFSGDYVDLRFVKSRKVAQVVIELPIEQAAAFVASFGAPNPATGVPVALARLDGGVQEQSPPAKEKRRFTELPPSQQAAMRCNEPEFQRFLAGYCDIKQVPDSTLAAALVRSHCGVESRADLDRITDAADMWRSIDADYFAWQRGGIR